MTIDVTADYKKGYKQGFLDASISSEEVIKQTRRAWYQKGFNDAMMQRTCLCMNCEHDSEENDYTQGTNAIRVKIIQILRQRITHDINNLWTKSILRY